MAGQLNHTLDVAFKRHGRDCSRSPRTWYEKSSCHVYTNLVWLLSRAVPVLKHMSGPTYTFRVDTFADHGRPEGGQPFPKGLSYLSGNVKFDCMHYCETRSARRYAQGVVWLQYHVVLLHPQRVQMRSAGEPRFDIPLGAIRLHEYIVTIPMI